MNLSLTACQAGARSLLRFKRMWILLWLCNTLLALLLTAPLAALIVANLGHTKFAGQMTASMDVQWLAEFLFAAKSYPFAMTVPAAALIFFAAVPFATFLAGGALWLLVYQATGYSPQRFFEGCGKFFWRFVRLFLISLVCYGLILSLNKSFDKIADNIWGESLVETPVVYFGWVKGIVVLALLAIVNMVFDYAKIRIVAEDGSHTIRAALWSLRFCRRNFRVTFTAFLLTAALGLGFLLLYFGLTLPTDRATLPAIIGVFLVMQLYVFSRVWIRLQFWSSATEIYHSLNPAEPEPVPPVEELAG